MSPCRAPDRHAHADLARALGDRHQHDVHHADAADHQRDHGDGGDQQRQRCGGALDGLADLVGVVEVEILAAVARVRRSRDRLPPPRPCGASSATRTVMLRE